MYVMVKVVKFNEMISKVVSNILVIILNYIFTLYLLHLLKHQETQTVVDSSNSFNKAAIKALFILVPVGVTAVILSFINWTAISSFGMTIFWGILISFIYNIIITRTLIVSASKNK